VSTLVPPLFAGLVDDASVLLPSDAGMTDAVARFRRHADAWYSHLLGAFLVPSSLVGYDRAPPGLSVSVVSDAALGTLPAALAKLRDAGAVVRQVEAAVARRGEDP
jgi:hypothetical protein